MADRTSHKRRHSTPPPSVFRSDLAADITSSATLQPPTKKGKHESPGEKPEPRPANDQDNAPSTWRHAFPAQTRQEPYPRNSSTQIVALPGMEMITTQQNEGSGAGETASAMTGPHSPTAPTATSTLSGVSMPRYSHNLMPRQNQQMVSQYVQPTTPTVGSSAPADPVTLPFIDDFVSDAMTLSPLSFPPTPLDPEPEAYQEVTQATGPGVSAYPELESWMEIGYTTPSTPTSALPAPVTATKQPILPPPTKPAAAQPRSAPALLQQPINPATQDPANPTPIVPIEPTLVSENYLWTQVEAAQVTMVGTLTALLVRQRAGELGGEVDDRRVQTVTSNLINIMSLWYMLRRDGGWPL